MTGLTKADIVKKLSNSIGIGKEDTKVIIEKFFEQVRSMLEKGEGVKLSGFGNFCLRDKEERPGRNPKTGENIPVSARRVVTFKAGQKLRSKIEHYQETQEKD